MEESGLDRGEKPGEIVSPCGKWQVERWESSVFVDSYSSVPVAVMVIKECATGAKVAGSGDLRDASIEPIRFLGPRRMLVYSPEEQSYFDFSFNSGDLRRLARVEDALDDYTAIVLTAEPQGKWVIWGLFGPCSVLCLATAAAMVYERSVGAAVGSFLLAVAFALLATWRTTERHRQIFDPVRGEILVEVESWLYESETRYAVAEFTGMERRGRGATTRVVLTGKRELVILNERQATAISRCMNLHLGR